MNTRNSVPPFFAAYSSQYQSVRCIGTAGPPEAWSSSPTRLRALATTASAAASGALARSSSVACSADIALARTALYPPTTFSRKNGSEILSPTALTSSSSAASFASPTAASRVGRYDETPTHISRLIRSWQYADDGTSDTIQSGRSGTADAGLDAPPVTDCCDPPPPPPPPATPWPGSP